MAENSQETEPLMSSDNDGVIASTSPPPLPRTHADSEAELNAIDATIREEKEKRSGDWIGAGLAIGSMLILFIFTLTLILRSNPQALRYFAFHPPSQALALTFFTLGTLTLQPTRQPKHKEVGLRWHQVIQLGLGLPIILFGSISMFINKIDHHAPHFTTWHAKFGLLALIWLALHIIIGAASVWIPVRAFGSVDNGKALWKWHRLSGYLLTVWFFLTVHLAGGHADWVVAETSFTERFWIYTILPITAIFGIGLRIRTWKLPGFQKPNFSVGVVS